MTDAMDAHTNITHTYCSYNGHILQMAIGEMHRMEAEELSRESDGKVSTDEDDRGDKAFENELVARCSRALNL